MDQKLEFNTLLASLVEQAHKNHNRLDKKMVAQAFEEIGIDSSMHDHIYQYLSRQQILLIDEDETITTKQVSRLTEADQAFYKEQGIHIDDDIFGAPELGEDQESFTKTEDDIFSLYKDELESMDKLSLEEEANLIQTYFKAKALSKIPEDLVNQVLPLVIEEAQKRTDCGITLGELVAEGNLALMSGVTDFDYDHSLSDQQLVTAFHAHCQDVISAGLDFLIEAEQVSKNTANHMADRANLLDHASTELSEKFGHAPSLEELSKFTGLPEEEISQVIRESLNAMTIQQDSFLGDESSIEASTRR